MLLPWWRERRKMARQAHVGFRHRRLAFERLEDRCLLSARPVSLLADGLPPPDQAVLAIHASSLSIATQTTAITLSAVTLTSATQDTSQAELSQPPPSASK